MDDKCISLGAKILSDKSTKQILPNYENIQKDIENIRKINSNYIQNNDDCSIIKKTNNTISILGKRGTGKSSILHTIHNKLIGDCNKYKDIVLDIIEPELMEEDDLLGWLIGAFNKIVLDYERAFLKRTHVDKCEIVKQTSERKPYGVNADGNCFKNCINGDVKIEFPIKDSFDKFVDTYIKKNKAYKEIKNKDYSGDNKYRQDMIDIFCSDVQLWKNFESFIEQLTKYINIVNGLGCEESALIFILFDDLDLIPYNSVKLLEKIILYLNKPNIVVFIAGDYENMQERIMLKYLKEDHILNPAIYNESILRQNTNRETVLESRKTLAYDFLKKMLPIRYRYNLIEFNSIAAIKNFKAIEFNYTDKNNEEEYDLENLLKKFIDYDNTKIIPDYCYIVFPSKPRGLISLYKFLYENQGSNNVYNKKTFFDNIVEANDIYQLYINEIKQIYILEKNKDGKYSIVIESVKLEALCQSISNNTNNIKRAHEVILNIQLFFLFMNQMDCIYDNENDKNHKKDIIKWINKYISVILKNEKFDFLNNNIFDLKQCLDIFIEIRKKIGVEKLSNLETSSSILKDLFEIYLKVFRETNNLNFCKMDMEEFIENIFIYDYEWTKTFFEYVKSYFNKEDSTKEITNVDKLLSDVNMTIQEKNIINNAYINLDEMDILGIIYPDELLDLFYKLYFEITYNELEDFITYKLKKLKPLEKNIEDIYYIRLSKKYKSIINGGNIIDIQIKLYLEKYSLDSIEEATLVAIENEILVNGSKNLEQNKLDINKFNENDLIYLNKNLNKFSDLVEPFSKRDLVFLNELNIKDLNEKILDLKSVIEIKQNELNRIERDLLSYIKIIDEKTLSDIDNLLNKKIIEIIKLNVRNISYFNSFILEDYEYLSDENLDNGLENIISLNEKINGASKDLINIIKLEEDNLDSDIHYEKIKFCKLYLDIINSVQDIFVEIEKYHYEIEYIINNEYYFDESFRKKIYKNRELLKIENQRLEDREISIKKARNLIETDYKADKINKELANLESKLSPCLIEKEEYDSIRLKLEKLCKFVNEEKDKNIKTIVNEIKTYIENKDLESDFEKIIDFKIYSKSKGKKETQINNTEVKLLGDVLKNKKSFINYDRYLDIKEDNIIMKMLDEAYKSASDKEQLEITILKKDINTKQNINKLEIIEKILDINSRIGYLDEADLKQELYKNIRLKIMEKSKLNDYINTIYLIKESKCEIENLIKKDERINSAIESDSENENNILKIVAENDIYKAIVEM